VGTLIGLIFLMPVAGLAIGAVTGALGGKLADVGINDDTIRRIGEQLQGAGRRCSCWPARPPSTR
jgi:uncharacterized membrane protein